MKLKIAVGRLNQVDQLTPMKQKDYKVESPKSAMDAFKDFFDKSPELDLPQDAEFLLQAGEVWTISTVLALKYYLKEAGMGLEYYAFDEADASILDDITRISGILLLDDAQKYFGFIPRGHFLRLTSEEDANPIHVYTWIQSKIKMFPGISSDPYSALLTQTKELMTLMGAVSTPVVSRFMGILSAFEKRIVII
jgi:hypothetical protein